MSDADGLADQALSGEDVVSLNGEWAFRPAGAEEWERGTVPGDVYTDLLRNDAIPDPFVGDNELDVQWVGETAWEYRRTVDLDGDFLDHDAVLIECLGLDTVAEVAVNGATVLETANMHREHAVDVSDHLREGENAVAVRFDSPVEYAAERRREHPYDVPLIRYPVDQPGRNFVRKAQCHFGWDWGPCLPTVGIWRDVRLVGHSVPRVDYTTTEQTHRDDGSVTLAVRAGLDAPRAGEYAVSAAVDGHETRRNVSLDAGETEVVLTFDVPDPDLWWPNGYGDQPLSDLVVTVSDGDRVATATDRIGFRDLELVREADARGESFRFEVNGEPVYAKGANWIPADALPGRVDDADYDDLLSSAAAANMNMVRVWGGGVYERDAFYETCDELGLLVWQDFMFACALYPGTDEFVESVEGEATDQVRRLANHPSLALWCGNNENEMSLVSWFADEDHIDDLYEDYERLNGTLADVVSAEDPSRSFWTASPSSGAGEYDPYDEGRGDLHYWDVWHDGAPFSDYLDVEPRFVSEFGYQSFPSIDLLESVIPADQLNPTAPLMEHHQRHENGNRHQLQRMADRFRIPFDFGDFVYLSQIQQGLAMQTAIEHWRRLKPVCMGTLYWQLNDLWPCASWSSVEYGGHWKALQHQARRFYAPVLVSSLVEDDALDVWVTSDRPAERDGTLTVEAVTFDGETVLARERAVTVDPHESDAFASIPLDEIDGPMERTMIRVAFDGDEESYANSEFLKPYKHLELPPADVDVTVEDDEVVVESSAAVLFVELSAPGLDGRFSDNYFHVAPGERKRVGFEGDAAPERLRDVIEVTHLRETY